MVKIYKLYIKEIKKEPEENGESEHSHSHDHEDPSEEDDLDFIDDPQFRRMMGLYCKFSLSKYEITHPVRLFCIKTFEWPWFDRIIIFLIAINSLMLGFMDYTY